MATKTKTATTEKNEIKQQTCNPANIKRGDLMMVVHYVRVDGIDSWRGVMHVTNVDDGVDFTVKGKGMLQRCLSADQFDEEKKVSRTAVAEKLISSYNKPLTVNFIKKEGEERTMRGRLVQPEPLMGRSHVEDLDVQDGHRLRLVDHRSLQWLIVDGVKYIVK